jgi:hypothetical protein
VQSLITAVKSMGNFAGRTETCQWAGTASKQAQGHKRHSFRYSTVPSGRGGSRDSLHPESAVQQPQTWNSRGRAGI